MERGLHTINEALSVSNSSKQLFAIQSYLRLCLQIVVQLRLAASTAIKLSSTQVIEALGFNRASFIDSTPFPQPRSIKSVRSSLANVQAAKRAPWSRLSPEYTLGRFTKFIFSFRLPIELLHPHWVLGVQLAKKTLSGVFPCQRCLCHPNTSQKQLQC